MADVFFFFFASYNSAILGKIDNAFEKFCDGRTATYHSMIRTDTRRALLFRKRTCAHGCHPPPPPVVRITPDIVTPSLPRDCRVSRCLCVTLVFGLAPFFGFAGSNSGNRCVDGGTEIRHRPDRVMAVFVCCVGCERDGVQVGDAEEQGGAAV